MRTNKTITLIALLLVLLLSVTLAACDDGDVPDIGSDDVDSYDKLYETDKWYYNWDVVDASDDGSATDTPATKLSAEGKYFIKFGIRLGVKSNSFDGKEKAYWWTDVGVARLKFVLVLDGGTVLYDDQAVNIGASNATRHAYGDHYDVEVDLNHPLNSRFSIGDYAGTSSITDVISDEVEELSEWDNETYTVTKWFFRVSRTDMTIEFSPKQNGTLYIDFAAESGDRENICLSAGQSSYAVGDSADSLTGAVISNVSVGYLAKDKYELGSYVDGDLTAAPSFDSGIAYMVVDFDFNALADNDGRAAIKVAVGVFGTAFSAKIEEVTSGTIFDEIESGVTKMYARFKVPPKAVENKSVRMFVRLTLSGNENDALSEFGADVLFAGVDGTSVSGKCYNSYVFSVSGATESPLVFELVDGGYAVTGITDTSVTSLVIPQKYNGYDVVQIKEGLLEECISLQSLTIPFVGCYRLNQGSGRSDFGVLYGCKDHYGLTETEYKVPSSLKTVIISEGATAIGEKAFENCNSITSIVVPSTVTSIGEEAFYGCDALQNITLPFIGADKDGTYDTNFSYIFGYAPESLKQFVIPDGTTELGDNAFNSCKYLKNIVIPDSVISIGDGAFSGCSGLTSIEIPIAVTSIGSNAFSACSSLASIEIPDAVMSLGAGAFIRCTGLTSVSFGENSQLKSIGGKAFAYCSSLTSVVLPEGVTSMGERVFQDSGVVSVELSEELTELPNDTFFECFNLESIVIPSSITSFTGHSFYRCTALESVIFNGTMEQWLAISKPNGWNIDAYSVGYYTFKIYCTDGTLDVHGNVLGE